MKYDIIYRFSFTLPDEYDEYSNLIQQVREKGDEYKVTESATSNTKTVAITNGYILDKLI